VQVPERAQIVARTLKLKARGDEVGLRGELLY